MSFCRDRRAKGQSIVAHMDSRGIFTFGKVASGWVIDKTSNNLDKSNWVFCECRNFERFRIGMVAILFTSHSAYEDLEIFKSRKESDQAFLCIVIGYSVNPIDESMNIHIRRRKGGRQSSQYDTTIPIYNMFSDTTDSFRSSDVRLIFLNLIGPHHELLIGYHLGQSVQNENLSPTFSCKVEPDRIEVPHESIRPDISSQLIRLKPMEMRSNFRFVRGKTDVHYKNRKLMELVEGPNLIETYFFKRQRLIHLEKTDERIFLIEYLGRFNQNSSFVRFAPLTLRDYRSLVKWFECQDGNTVYYTSFNRKLDEILASSGRTAITVINISLKSPGHKINISILDKDEEPPQYFEPISGFDGAYVAKTREKTLRRHSLAKNYFDEKISCGVVIFRCYTWPYQNSITSEMASVLKQCFQGKGLSRHGVSHQGTFQMLSHRQSNQASASMVCTPGNTINHEYFREEDAKNNLLPIARKIANKLSSESIHTGYSSGEILMDLLHKATVSDRGRDAICPYGILTTNGFFNSIHPDNDFMSDEEYNAVISFINSLPDSSKSKANFSRYLERVTKFIGKDRTLPKSTTCCWTIPPSKKYSKEDFDGFELRQHFVSVDGGFAFNISSEITQDLEQVGATFLAPLFLHCTSISIFFNEDSGKVSISGKNRKYNTAWGKAGGKANPKKSRKSSRQNKRRKTN